MKEEISRVLTIILAGGQGERLYPLTKNRAKPAVPFGGNYRIIDFTLSNCLNSQFRRIYVLTQYKSDSLDRHIRLGWNIFNHELGEYIYTVPPQRRSIDKWYQGTADAIFQNIYTLQKERPEKVMILSGDHVYKMDYTRMLAFHLEKNADITVGGVEVTPEEAKRFGVMQVDEDFRMIGFQEKPKEPRSIPGKPDRALGSMGIYIFETPVLVRSVSEDAKRDTAHDFGRNIIPDQMDKSRVYVYPFRNEKTNTQRYWRDIGTLDSYYETNMDLIAVEPNFNLYNQAWPMRTYMKQAPPAKTVFTDDWPGGRIGKVMGSMISQGCIVSGGAVEHSLLSPNVRINSFSHVKDCILLEGVDIGRHAKVRNAIIDKYVTVPPGFQIGYDLHEDAKKYTVTPNGIVVVPMEMDLT